eukprot:CAMPEP_0201507888 /NCGR_PEP_ID=MMETSP0161_2-20130828/1405_1 /ASSEMBLY_ACC=CAM_ASM_000251 /TAXON_ID=180227 /ORGANISM="Neoparamoeba aestuarina, Strain SoJaBio B1-5/56/2" /LENGTH=110 /DNA_ID=CAMNT_0047902367 /DNA_START=154 /DNA_END=486 /DNA_ORIENTATION=+
MGHVHGKSLVEYVEEGDLRAVKRFARERPESLNERGNLDNWRRKDQGKPKLSGTPIEIAAYYGYEEICIFLLDQGCKPGLASNIATGNGYRDLGNVISGYGRVLNVKSAR